MRRLSSWGTRADWPQGMLDPRIPRPGVEYTSPSLEGGFPPLDHQRFPGWYILAISWSACSLITSLKETHTQPLSQSWVLISAEHFVLSGFSCFYICCFIVFNSHYKSGIWVTFPVCSPLYLQCPDWCLTHGKLSINTYEWMNDQEDRALLFIIQRDKALRQPFWRDKGMAN